MSNPSDRDGAIDILFSTCSRVSTSSGVGTDCNINIAYNKQVPLCSSESAKYRGDEGVESQLLCRGWGDLCIADDAFDFSFDPTDDVSRAAIY